MAVRFADLVQALRVTPSGHRPKPLGLTSVLDEGFRVAKKIFPPLLPVVLLAAVPGLLTLGFGYGTLDSGPAVDIDVASYVRVLAGSVVGFLLFQSICEPLSIAVVYAAAIAAYEDRAWSVRTAVGETLRRFGAVFAIGALYYGTVYGLLMLTLVGAVAIVGAGFAAASGELSYAVAIAAVGGVLSAGSAVASIWFALRYGFSLPALVAEPQSPAMASFGRSARVMSGAYVSVAVVVLLLGAMRWGLTMATSALVPPPTFRTLEPDELFALLPTLIRTQLLQQSVGVVISAVFAIYAGACWIVLYGQRRAAVDDQSEPSNGTSASPADA